MELLKIELKNHLDKTALIHYKKEELRDEITYKALLEQIVKIGLIIEGERLVKNESLAIGILSKKSPAAISLLLAILESNHAFCFISRSDVPDDLNKFGVKYFFSEEAID